MTVGIYAVVNPETGAAYIGASRNIEKRWLSHQGLLLRQRHPYQTALGGDAIMRVLEETPGSCLSEAEQDWLSRSWAVNRSRIAYPTESGRVPLPSLRRIRLQQSFSQRDLAREADVAQRTVTSAEQGAAVTLRTTRKLAPALGVTPDELRAESDDA